jgi:methyltransferase
METVAIGLLVFLPMLVEARRAARHERLLLARGGIEPPGDVYRLMQLAYPGVFLAMLIEQIVYDVGASMPLFAVGLGLFAAGKLLKWWAILSLGPFWTFRVIVVPHTVPVNGGPYRFFSHPNYIGVIGELVGGALMTAASIAGPIGIALFFALMLRRVAVESRARDAILRRS